MKVQEGRFGTVSYRPPCPSTVEARFMNVFMIHFGRCGSTALADDITRIPGFFWHGEIFSEGTLVYDGFEASELSKKKIAGSADFDLSEFLDFIDVAKRGIQQQIGRHITRYGCEIKGYHFEYGYFKFSLDTALGALASRFPDSRFIFLRRRNSLRRILSSVLARQTGVYHVTTFVDTPNRIKLDLNHFVDMDLNCRGEITAVLRNSMMLGGRFSEVVLRHGGFEICYEDHIKNSMDPAMAILSDRLKVERVLSETHLKKTNPFAMIDMIENYDDLRERLTMAGMERFLA